LEREIIQLEIERQALQREEGREVESATSRDRAAHREPEGNFVGHESEVAV
jgi:hypothetical protein